jgi:hypothetical protein
MPSQKSGVKTKYPDNRVKGRRRTIAVVSAVLAFISYGLKELAQERFKDLGDAVQAAESLYRTEQGQSTASIQLIQDALNEQIKEIREEQSNHPDKATVDYSDVIRTDSIQRQRMSGNLNVDYDDVSRLLDSLPRQGGSLRKQLEELKPTIADIKQHIDAALKPSPKHDWTRLIEIKLLEVRVALEEILVLVIGDSALTAAHKTEEAAEKLYHFLQWACYGLFTMAVVMGLYAAMTGMEGVAEIG